MSDDSIVILRCIDSALEKDPQGVRQLLKVIERVGVDGVHIGYSFEHEKPIAYRGKSEVIYLNEKGELKRDLRTLN